MAIYIPFWTEERIKLYPAWNLIPRKKFIKWCIYIDENGVKFNVRDGNDCDIPCRASDDFKGAVKSGYLKQFHILLGHSGRGYLNVNEPMPHAKELYDVVIRASELRIVVIKASGCPYMYQHFDNQDFNSQNFNAKL